MTAATLTVAEAGADLTIEQVRAELDAAEAWVRDLRTELARAEARANQLRQQSAAAMFSQAEAMLAQVQPDRLPQPLTPRELEIARICAASRISLPEVALQLWVSVNTVRTHAKNIYRKLGINHRSELRQALLAAAKAPAEAS